MRKSRPRPSSMDGHYPSPDEALPRRPVTPGAMKHPGSAPPTARSDYRPLPRSKTVYINDIEHLDAGADHSGNSPTRRERPGILRPALTVGGDAERGRLPSSALRSASGGASSRSISWGAEQSREPMRTSSAASSPLRDSRPSAKVKAMSSSTLSKEAGGIFTKRNSGSEGKSSAERRTSSFTSEDQEAKGRTRSDRSVKDVAGAIARFWVG